MTPVYYEKVNVMRLNDKTAFRKLKDVFFQISAVRTGVCAYGRYAPAMLVIIKPSAVYSKKVHAALTFVF